MRNRLAHRFEIGRHPLRFVSETAGRLTFHAANGDVVGGYLVAPDAPPPWPTVLMIHAHGDRYDIGARELVHGRPASPLPLGPVLADRGIASVCIDLPCFGTRTHETESTAAKAALWRGGSLAGRMLGELSSQLDWLSSDPRFGKLAVYGISMGATLGYWLAAVDQRIAALAQLCCLADMDTLIANGAHDRHGIYLTIPGLPAQARNGQIAGMVAPRPQFIGLGAQDPLTPDDARGIALGDVAEGYAKAPSALQVMIEPNHGHEETPAMREAVLRFFEDQLRR